LKKHIKNLIFISSLCLILTSCSKHSEAFLDTTSNKLKETKIISHMETKIDKGNNLIYCSTFQLAWNELKDTIIKDNISLSDEPEMVKYLNKSLSTKKDLSDASYVALAGYAKDGILNKINAELKEKFNSEAPKVNEKLHPEDIMAYSFLLKDLQFEKPFEDLKGKLTFQDKIVKAFGIYKYEDKHEEIGKQVDVLFYNKSTSSRPEEFAVTLKAQNSSDEITLALVNPSNSLLETYEYIQSNIKSNSASKLNEGENLIIPKFDFNISHSYDELLQKHFINKGFEDYFIAKATQDTKFKLDEKGAKLKSEAKIIGTKSAPVSLNRNLIFNKPFALYMKEKGAKYPYFMMWVDNPEILVK
jgi:hypothetical protein